MDAVARSYCPGSQGGGNSAAWEPTRTSWQYSPSTAAPSENVKTLVHDSWPIMEWILGKEPAASAVEKLLEDAESSTIRLLMSAINVGEVYLLPQKA
jgi:hypothetical protein